MTQSTIASDLRQEFSDNWSLTTSSTIKWPNTRFEPPSTAWVEFNIIFGKVRNAIIASTNLTSRVNGVVDIKIYLPLHEGVQQGYTLSEAAKLIFQNNQFNRTQCLSGAIEEVGRVKVGGEPVEYYQFRVLIPFFSYIT